MNPIFDWNIALAALALTAGVATISYEGVASTRGWPAGEWFTGPISFLQSAAWFCVLGGLASSYFYGVWWSPIFVLFLGVLLTRLLLLVFGPHIQVVAFILVWLGTFGLIWQLWIYYMQQAAA